MTCGFCKGACNHTYPQNGKLKNVQCFVCNGNGALDPIGNGTINSTTHWKETV